MLVEVEMCAFMGPDVIRKVDVPDPEVIQCGVTDPYLLLERVFYYGQNDFQPVWDRASVSMGDIIRLRGKRYRVEGIGFSLVNE